jgi:hypothetical protein
VQVAERDREAAQRAAVADAAPAASQTEEASEQAAAERARMAAELDAACEEIAALRKQVPPSSISRRAAGSAASIHTRRPSGLRRVAVVSRGYRMGYGRGK